MLRFVDTSDEDETSFSFTYETETMQVEFHVYQALEMSKDRYDALAEANFGVVTTGACLGYFKFGDDGQQITLHRFAMIDGKCDLTVEFESRNGHSFLALELPFHVCHKAFGDAAVWRAAFP